MLTDRFSLKAVECGLHRPDRLQVADCGLLHTDRARGHIDRDLLVKETEYLFKYKRDLTQEETRAIMYYYYISSYL